MRILNNKSNSISEKDLSNPLQEDILINKILQDSTKIKPKNIQNYIDKKNNIDEEKKPKETTIPETKKSIDETKKPKETTIPETKKYIDKTKKPEEINIPITQQQTLYKPKEKKDFILKRIRNKIAHKVRNTIRFFQIIHYVKPLISIAIRQKVNVNKFTPADLEKILQNVGGGIAKALQPISSFPKPMRQEWAKNLQIQENQLYNYFKKLSKVSSENKPMDTKELLSCLNKSSVPYNQYEIENRKLLGCGTIGEVNLIKTTLEAAPYLVVKSVSPTAQKKLFSDISICKFIIKTISFLKPSLRPLLHMTSDLLNEYKKEFDLTDEYNNTIKQQEYFNEVKLNEKTTTLLDNLLESGVLDQDESTKSTLKMAKILTPEIMSLYLQMKQGIDNKEKDSISQFIQLTNKNLIADAPLAHLEYSNDKTLILQKIDGATLSESENRHEELKKVIAKLINKDTKDISDHTTNMFRNLCKISAFEKWKECIKNNGFFHADLHDGNIMVAEENGNIKLYFIDFGATGQIDKNIIPLFEEIEDQALNLRIAIENKTKNKNNKKINVRDLDENSKNELNNLCIKIHGLYDNSEKISIEEHKKKLLKIILMHKDIVNPVEVIYSAFSNATPIKTNLSKYLKMHYLFMEDLSGKNDQNITEEINRLISIMNVG